MGLLFSSRDEFRVEIIEQGVRRVGGYVAAVGDDGDGGAERHDPVGSGGGGCHVPVVDSELSEDAAVMLWQVLGDDLVVGGLLDEHDGTEWVCLVVADAAAAAYRPAIDHETAVGLAADESAVAVDDACALHMAVPQFGVGRFPGSAGSAQQDGAIVVQHIGAVENVDAVGCEVALQRQGGDEDGVDTQLLTETFQKPDVGMGGRGFFVDGVGIAG